MKPFFLGGLDCESEGAEDAYSELRERSHSALGCPARQRRIFRLDCRYEGRDCEIEVGALLPGGDATVVAILDHGREQPFAVHTLHEPAPTCVARPVYAVTDFS